VKEGGHYSNRRSAARGGRNAAAVAALELLGGVSRGARRDQTGRRKPLAHVGNPACERLIMRLLSPNFEGRIAAA